MIEFVIYDTLFFLTYIYVGTWICKHENYSTADDRFYKEISKGTKGLLLQLPISNIAMTTIVPYTRLSDTFTFGACIEYLIMFDLLQFIIHYMLHMNKTVYKKIHMDHHKTVYVMPFSATNLTLYEIFITGLIPTLLPLFFIDIDFIGWTVMNIFFFIHSLFIHSTFKLPYEPLLLGSQNHAAHHMKKTINYGFLLPVWDQLARVGTYQIPRDHIRQRIHRYYDNKGKCQ